MMDTFMHWIVALVMPCVMTTQVIFTVFFAPLIIKNGLNKPCWTNSQLLLHVWDYLWWYSMLWFVLTVGLSKSLKLW